MNSEFYSLYCNYFEFRDQRERETKMFFKCHLHNVKSTNQL